MNKYIILSIFCFITYQINAMNEITETNQELILRARKNRSDGFPQKSLSALCPNNIIQITLAPLDEGKLAPLLMIEKDGIQYEKEMKRFYYQAVGVSSNGKRFAVIYSKPFTTHTGKTWLEIQEIVLKRNKNGKNIIITQKKDKRYIGPFCATVLAFNKQETALMSNNIGIWRNKDIDIIFPFKKNEGNEDDEFGESYEIQNEVNK